MSNHKWIIFIYGLEQPYFLGLLQEPAKRKKHIFHIPSGKTNNHEQIQEFMVIESPLKKNSVILVASNILKGIVALVVVNC